MEAAHAALDQALLRAVQRGALLHAQIDMDERQDVLYFINSARGRAAIQAIQRGEWRPSGEFEQPVEYFPGDERPNIFSLYEQHFGPLTPMIAEALRSAENDYPASWIEDAMRIAVQNNKRSWSYTEAILRRWQEGGRDDREDRRDLEKDRRRYAEWDQPRRK
jgi:DnaD/phage-associated family protein